MDIVVENYIFSNLRIFLRALLAVYESTLLIYKIFQRLFFISKGPLTIRGETRELEKNYPDIY